MCAEKVKVVPGRDEIKVVVKVELPGQEVTEGRLFVRNDSSRVSGCSGWYGVSIDDDFSWLTLKVTLRSCALRYGEQAATEA